MSDYWIIPNVNFFICTTCVCKTETTHASIMYILICTYEFLLFLNLTNLLF
jgi:hypothetical protein